MTEPVFEQVTLWVDPEEKFLSGKGVVTRKEWCYSEAERLKQTGKMAEVQYDIMGKCAVFAEKKRR